MESAFRYYRPVGGPRDARQGEFADWVLRVCADPNLSDHHVVPQSDLLQGVSTQVLKWDFERLASVLGPPIMPQHQSDHSILTPWTAEAREAFERRYEQDIKVWRGNETEQHGALPANPNPTARRQLESARK
jgi:hypothetical protein